LIYTDISEYNSLDVNLNDIKIAVQENLPFARVVVKKMIPVEAVIDDSNARAIKIDKGAL